MRQLKSGATKKPTQQSDVYSCGVLVHKLVEKTGLKGEAKGLLALAARLCAESPEERPTAAQAMEDPAFLAAHAEPATTSPADTSAVTTPAVKSEPPVEASVPSRKGSAASEGGPLPELSKTAAPTAAVVSGAGETAVLGE